MTLTELNAKGNFDSWKSEKLKEIRKEQFSKAVGTALFENHEIRLWEINLKPKERIPFRIHNNNYSCTSFTDALLVSRNINGQIGLIRLQKGDNFYWQCKGKEMVHDLENIGETKVKIAVLEEKINLVEVCKL